MEKTKTNSSSKHEQSHFFPPVVSLLGHVDHGKTTLLDAIRKTNVAASEHGGITQKIGASQVEVVHDNQKRSITFIDTPGHETFSLMRTRGAKTADIGLLVVSLVDGVMPQTKESIQLFQNAQIPFIAVLTKADSPEKMPEKVKQQLLKEGVMLEGMGGDVPIIEVSAKTNQNIKELLELILLVYELHLTEEIKARSVDSPLSAIVIESKRDLKSGPLATLVVKNGNLKIGDELICENIKGKVKALITDTGEHVKSATIGEAVSVLGFEQIPQVGSIVTARGIQTVSQPPKIAEDASLAPSAYVSEKDKGALSIVLVADTFGSLEAITNALPGNMYVIQAKTGEVSEADVLLAKSTGALIIGFHTKIRSEVAKLVEVEKVLFKNYTIIYELLDELKDVIEGKQLATQEKILGKAQILASFPFEKTKVMGIKVVEGRIAKGDRVRLTRGEEAVGESRITSVRQAKEQVSKVEKGQEAGIIVSPFLDFTIGDVIESVG